MKKITILLKAILITIFLLSSTTFYAQLETEIMDPNVASVTAASALSCGSQDVQFNRVYLGDELGNEIVDCENPVDTYIWVDLYKASSKYGLYVEFSLWIDGIQVYLDGIETTDLIGVSQADVDPLDPGYPIYVDRDYRVIAIPYTCGARIELKDIYISWGPSSSYLPNEDQDGPKCDTTIPNITVDGPLFVDFGNVDEICNEVTVTTDITGGKIYEDATQTNPGINLPILAPYEIEINYGDGTDTITVSPVLFSDPDPTVSGDEEFLDYVFPTHIYPTNTTSSPIPYTITLTATDTAIPPQFASAEKIITIHPEPSVIATNSGPICNDITSISLDANGDDIESWSWESDGSATITNPNDKSPIVTNFVNGEEFTVTITDIYGCVATDSTIILINPTPTVTTVSNQTYCSGEVSSSTTLSGPVTGTTFTWTNDNTAIGLAASGSGNIPSFTATNSGNTPLTATITIIPTANNCIGTVSIFTITINPTAQVNTIADQVVCNADTTTAITFSTTNTVGTTTYDWTNNTPGIGLSATGSGDIAAFSGVNLTTAPIVATIIVTPTFSNDSIDCAGPTETFTITVNPAAQVNTIADQVVCNADTTTAITFSTTNTVGTTTYDWTNDTPGIGLSATGSGDIAAFSGVNLTTAPIVATIIVTPTFSNGSVDCIGPTETFTITVNPAAQVDAIADQVVCNADTTTAITFSTTNTVGTTTYDWTNDTPGIGLSATGSGDIAAFSGVNLTTAPIVATIIVTPTFSNGSVDCIGPTETFTITVNPAAQVDAIADQVVCNADNTTAVVFTTTNTVGTTTYSWTNDDATIGLAASGTGDIALFAATNAGTAPVIATITVTPTFNNDGVNCTGPTEIFTITVNPTAQVDAIADQVVCNADTTTAITFSTTNTVGTTTYDWTNNTPGIGLSATGSGDIAAFSGVNLTTAPIVAAITVTPTFNNDGVNCTGPTETFTITVNPAAQVDAIADQVVCNADTTTAITFSTTNTVGTTTYDWTNDTPGIGLSATGSGDIAAFSGVNLTTAPIVATIIVTPTFSNGSVDCTGPTEIFTITVNPTAQVDAIADQVVCNADTTTAITFSTTNTVGTTTYDWTNNTPGIGLSATGSGDIAAFSGVNLTTAPIVAAITVTPTFNNDGVNCTGPTEIFTITVNPTAQVDAIADQVVCNADTTTAITFSTTNTVGTTTYDWTNNTPGIGLSATGSGDIAAFSGVNLTTAPIVATITVTPTFNNDGVNCTGPTETFTITVNPAAQVDAIADQVVCNADNTTAVAFTTTNTVGTTTYSWTNDDATIGLAASGTGDIALFAATNAGTAPVVATITVTPTFNNDGVNCTGPTETFTITVNPAAQVDAIADQVVCNADNTTAITFSTTNTVGTTTYDWTNNTPGIGLSATGSGDIAVFSGVNLTTAPIVATIIVTPTFSNGSVDCIGPTETFTITVNPAAQVDAIADQVVCNADNTTAVAFTTTNTVGTTTYSWTNDDATIGLDASGTGDIALFAATNAGTAPIVATITVTPTFNNDGVNCTGPTEIFTITVNPAAQVDAIADQVVCNADTTTAITFSTTNTVGTTTYDWTNNTPGIGLSATGSGDIAAFSGVNLTTAPIVATITVTPTFNNDGVNCTGPTEIFTITVNPAAQVDAIADQVVCNADTTTAITFSTTNTVGTTTYDWTNNTPGIGLSATGSGDIAAFSGVNLTTAPIVAAIIVTPTFSNGSVDCTGPTEIFTITVNPTAQVDAIADQVVCNADTTTAITFSTTNTVGTTTYDWTNNTPGIGLSATGSGDIAAFSGVNLTTAPIVATIIVTPTFSNDSVDCTGPTETFTITVNPAAQVDAIADQVVCNADTTTAITFSTTNTVGTTTYDWTNNTPGIGLSATGSGDIAAFSGVNLTTAPIVATITVTPTFSNDSVDCTGPTETFTITVNPAAQVDAIADQVVCNADTTTAITFSTTNTVGTTTYDWTNNTPGIGLSATGSGDIAAFSGVNLTTAPIVATITVTPTFSNDSVDCTGPTETFTITVNPAAQVDAIADQVVCNADTTTAITFSTTNTVGTTTYDWTNNTPGIGLSATGSGDIAAFSGVNLTTAPIVATITVTPTFNNDGVNCTGPTETFTITVNPAAQVDAIADQVVCNADTTTAITFSTTNTVGTTTYDWTNNTPGIGLSATGSGDIAAFSGVNLTTAPIVATITVTPTFSNDSVDCTGPTETFTITVNPAAQVDAIADQVVCNADTTTAITFSTTNTVGTTTYDWTNNTPGIGLSATGSGDIAAFSGVNLTTAPIVATITVTPTFNNDGVNCTGPTETFTITVNPLPVGTNDTIVGLTCDNLSFNIDLQALITNNVSSNFTWTVVDNPNVDNEINGSGDFLTGGLVNRSGINQSVEYIIIPTAIGSSCEGASFTITINVPVCAGMIVIKTGIVDGGGTTVSSTEDIINYTITLTNNGDANLTGVILNDPLIPILNLISSGDGDDILESGEVWTYTGAFGVTQQSLDDNGVDPVGSGFINNTVIVSSNEIDDIESSFSVPIDFNPNGDPVFEVTKTALPTVISTTGDIIYTVTVKNIGLFAINDVVVTDVLAPMSYVSGDAGLPGIMEIGETWEYTSTYTVTQTVLDGNGVDATGLIDGNGFINNTVDVTGEDPNNDPVTPGTDSFGVEIDFNPNGDPVFEVTKTALPTVISTTGDIIYTVTVKNIGLFAINDVVVTDVLAPMSYVSGDAGLPGIMEIGETWEYTGTYTVTQLDLDGNGVDATGLIDGNGFINNTVDVTGEDPNNDPVTPGTDSFGVEIDFNPNGDPVFEVTKTALPTVISTTGDIIYTVTVKNIGLFAINDVVVTDVLAPMSYVSGDAGLPGIMEIGETWEYTSTYTVTQTVLDGNGVDATGLIDGNGFINNTVDVTGEDPNNDPVTPGTDSFGVEIDFNPNGDPVFEVTKTALPTVISTTGDIIYTVTVKNIGLFAINDVVVTDVLAPMSYVSGDAGLPGIMEIGETWEYTSTYTVTQTVLDGNGVDATGLIDGNGFINNTVDVTGEDPNNDPVTPGTDSFGVEIDFNPNGDPVFEVTKTALPTVISTTGDIIYTVTVKNIGLFAINDVVVTDVLAPMSYVSGDAGLPGIMEIGETWEYTGTYTVTQLDLDGNGVDATGLIDGNGFINNTVDVTGEDPNNDPVTPGTDSFGVEIDFNPNGDPVFEVTKTALPTVISTTGDIIYTVTVKNIGLFAINDVVVTDVLAPMSYVSGDAGLPGIMEIGETWEYTGTYTVTQTVLDGNGVDATGLIDGNGFINNTVDVTGEDPNNDPVTPGTDSFGVEIDFNPTDPVFEVTKTALPTVISTTGDIIYTVTVKNIGLFAINDVVVTDVLAPMSYVSGDAGLPGIMEIGETWEYTGTYTVTQTVLDGNGVDATGLIDGNGFINNTVDVTGEDPNNDPVTPGTDSFGVEIDFNPNGDPVFEVTKTALPTVISTTGDIIYTVTVKNIGLFAINDVVVTDVLAPMSYVSGDAGLPGIMEIGETWEYTGTYTVTQLDLDGNGVDATGLIDGNGFINNTVDVTGEDPNNDPVTPGTDSFGVEIDFNPNGDPVFTVTNDADLAAVSMVGEVITYTVTVENIGDFAINTVVVTDPLATDIAYVSGDDGDDIMQIGEVWTYTGTYTVTQSDLDNNGIDSNGAIDSDGDIDNTASANGLDPAGDPVPEASADGIVPIEFNPNGDPVFTVTNDADLAAVSMVGEVITYTVTVENIGDFAINTVVVTDPLATDIAYVSGDDGDDIMQIGEVWTYTGTYTVTQSDLDNNGIDSTGAIDGDGDIDNTASANGLDPAGDPVPEASADGIVPIEFNPNGDPVFTVTNDADLAAVSMVGEVITYTVTVENIGDFAINTVVVTDPLATDIAYVSGDDGDDIMQIGEVWTYTGTYTVTQSDLDNNGIDSTGAIDGDGDIDNTASANGLDPAGDPVPEASADGIVPIEFNPNGDPVFTVTNDADLAAVSMVGEVITYTVTVENIGDFAINTVVVTDPLATDIAYVSGDDGDDIMQIGEVWTYTGTYTVTQSDLDNNGIDSNGAIDSDGDIDNTASANGLDPAGDPVPEASADGIVPIEFNPNGDPVFTVTNDADLAAVSMVGEVITYTVTVENIGDFAINTVVVTDPLATDIAYVSGDDGDDIMQIGEVWTYTGTYTVTQSDLDNNGIDSNGAIDSDGDIDNTASANGLDPAGDPVPEASADGIVPIEFNPNGDPVFTVTNDADLAAVSMVGEVITYTVTVENIGDFAINTVVVTDPLATDIAYVSGDDGDDIMQIGEVWTYTGTYTVTQSDLDNNGIDSTGAIDGDGDIDNTASANGLDPAGDPVPEASADGIVPIEFNPNGDPVFTVTNDADLAAVSMVGEVITYTVTVENIGDFAINTVVVTDPLATDIAYVSGDDGDDIMQIGEVWTYTGTYTVTQSDLDNNGIDSNGAIDSDGDIDNTASANGLDPAGDPVPEASADGIVPIEFNPNGDPVFTVTNDADLAAVSMVGEVITYTVTVENIGDFAINTVVVTDPLATDIAYVSGDDGDDIMQIGEVWTYTGTYTVTQSDLDNNGIDSNGAIDSDGDIDNTASANGLDPAGDPVPEASADGIVPIEFNPNGDPVFTVTNDADLAAVSMVGEVITYTVTVENIGDFAINTVVVTDPLATDIAYVSGDDGDDIMQIGEVWTYTGTYTVTQSDLDNNGIDSNGAIDSDGDIDNTASANGLDPAGDPVPEASADGIVPIEFNPNGDPVFTVTNDADLAAVSMVGEVITYTVTVENIGDFAINTVVVTDPLATDIAYVSGDDGDDIMQIGEVWTYTGTYTVTQSDLDNNGIDSNGAIDGDGDIDNTASANGLDPNGDPVPEASASEEVLLDYSIDPLSFSSVIKTADLEEISAVGDIINYTIIIANTTRFAVSNINTVDELVSLTLVSGDENSNDKLDVDETWTYTGSYIATEEAIVGYGVDATGAVDNDGDIDNIVSVTGTDPSGTVLGPISDSVFVIINIPLVAEDDLAETEANIPVDISILENDDDSELWIDGGGIIDTNSVIIIDEPENGTVIINNDGTVTYTPDLDFIGDDSFEYEVCDNHGLCDTAIVTIIVTGVLSAEFNIPQGFSPNGDGVHDVFYVNGLVNLYPNFQLEVYNRWGNVVYEYTHNGNPLTEPRWWDGFTNESNNREVPVGTYFYILHFNKDNAKPRSGYVYLNR